MSGIVNPTLAGHFDEVADAYNEAALRTNYSCPQWVREQAFCLSRAAPLNVLDLGCATGINTAVIRAQLANARVVGVDVSPRMIEIARASNHFSELHVHDLNHAMPYLASAHFDLVLALGCLEFLTELNICLAEISRVLKRGGRLWASFQRHIPGNPNARKHAFARQLRMTAYSQAEVVQLMLAADLHLQAIEETTGYTARNGFTCPYLMAQAEKRG